MSALSALSPLDGRYRAATAALRPLFCEQGLIRHRLLVETRWLQALAAHPDIPELPPFSAAANAALEEIAASFDDDDARRVKAIEGKINHDVKAVEYFLAERVADHPELKQATGFIHFGCTSEDVNNLAYALMARTARAEALLPEMQRLVAALVDLAHDAAELPMLALTHGQPASPTTLGKEMANFVPRLRRQIGQVEQAAIAGKFNGAVGNFNAHLAAFPQVDWMGLSRRFVESLGLMWSPHTTQIEPHDWIAELCHALMRFNAIVLDLDRDLWGYISRGCFRQRAAAGEVGSSTMPHKVNPIDFENSEGNLGLANAILGHLAEKLPVSRAQRDLSDSTLLRNLGVGLGHALIAWRSTQRGVARLEADPARLRAELEGEWTLLAEPIQTVMRRYGVANPYERLKALTRGRATTRAELLALVEGLEIPAAAKAALRALTPADYIGNAAEQARSVR